MPRTARGTSSAASRGRSSSTSRGRSNGWSTSPSPVMTLISGPSDSETVGRNAAAPVVVMIGNQQYGQTPDNFYHVTRPANPAVGRAQVKRKLILGSPDVVNDGFKTPKSKVCGKPMAKKNKGSKSPVEKTRYDTSLGLLTKRFVGLLQSAQNGVLELSRAATDLSVQKRRIYDITNVLEGINLIEKKSKNNIQWRGTDVGGVCSRQMNELHFELNNLETKENQLDNLMRCATIELQSLTEQPDTRYAYVTYQDIHNIKSLHDQTVVAVKAPPETSLEVPDPKENLQIWLKSKNGEIEVFLCPEESAAESEPSPVDGDGSDPANDVQDANCDMSLKRALISEQDDLGPMGSKSFLLQTEDQNVDLPFLPLDPPLSEDDYSFSLHEEEGLADLFDAYDFSCDASVVKELPLPIHEEAAYATV